MPLAEGSGNTNRFVCPYHAWTYGRDGSLLRAARMVNAGFDPASCKLHSHKMQLWNGFIYVNLSGEAEPFCFPELDELVEHYEPTKFRLVLENWSLATVSRAMRRTIPKELRRAETGPIN